MFKGHKVNLRSFELSDIEEMMKHINDYSLKRSLGNPFPTTAVEQEAWIRDTWKLMKEGKMFFFAIETLEKKKLIGLTGLYKESHINQSASYLIVIFDKSSWDKGYGTDALKIILSLGFEQLNLHSIYLKVFENNKRAIRSYEKSGFKKSVLMREAVYREGMYQNMVYMDILSSEYYDLADQSPKNWPRIGEKIENVYR